MESFSALDERIRRLERSNARLKGSLMVLGGFAVAVGLLGAVAPGPKTIKAERFILVDPAGNTRAELSANDKSTALQLINADGSRGVILAAGSTDNALMIADNKGQYRLALIASNSGKATFAVLKDDEPNEPFIISSDSSLGTSLSFRDPNGTDRVDLGFTTKGASVLVNDANGTTRAALGDEGFVAFKKGGELEWASFGENMKTEELKHVMDLLNSAPPPKN